MRVGTVAKRQTKEHAANRAGEARDKARTHRDAAFAWEQVARGYDKTAPDEAALYRALSNYQTDAAEVCTKHAAVFAEMAK